MSNLRTIASIDEIRVGQSVRTRRGRIDSIVVDVQLGFIATEQFTNNGRRRFNIVTRREIASGALRTYA